MPDNAAESMVDGRTPQLNVFMSYSRSDFDRVRRCVGALEALAIKCTIDTRDLPYGERWQIELRDFIKAADTIVFFVSPRSIVSKACNWEIAQAKAQSKRLVPVVLEAVPIVDLPPEISEIHLFPLTADLAFEDRMAALGATLLSNRAWIKEHTRLAERAAKWLAGDRARDHLLRGRALAEAEQWMTLRPSVATAPSQQHLDFIAASQIAAKHRGRLWLGGLTGATIAAVGLAAFAELNRREADRQRTEATAQRGIAVEQRNQALASQSRSLAVTADQQRGTGDIVTAMLLGLAGVPDQTSTDAVQRERPYVADAERALYAGFHLPREQKVAQAHAASANAVVVSPDGAMLATAGGDRKIRLWDATTLELKATLDGHEHEVIDLAFDPRGGQLLSTSSDQTARVWNIATATTVLILTDPVAGIVKGRFSPDGARIATGTLEGNVRIWDSKSGRELMSLPAGRDLTVTSALTPGSGFGFAVAFSRDGARMLTTGIENTALLTSIETGKDIGALTGHDGPIFSAAFSPDAKTIATASSDGTVRLWNATTLKQTRILRGHSFGVMSVEFNADGSRLVTTSRDRTARVWNTETFERVALLRGHLDVVISAVFIADTDRVATTAGDGTLRLWEFETSGDVPVLSEEGDAIVDIEFADNGRLVVTREFETYRAWDVESAQPLRHTVKRMLDVAPGAARALLSAGAHAIAVVDLDRNEVLVTLRANERSANESDRAFGSARFDANASKVVTTSNEPSVRLWDALNGREIGVSPRFDFAIVKARFSSDGENVIVRGEEESSAALWNIATGAITRLQGHTDAITSAIFDTDGRQVLTGSRDGTMRIWDVRGGRPTQVLGATAGTIGTFNPDGRIVATISGGFSTDRAVRLWDAGTGRAVSNFLGHTEAPNSVRFSPDGRRLLTTSTDKTARLWDVASGATVAVLRGHTESVSAAAFRPDGRYVATASLDGTARLWRMFPATQPFVDHLKQSVPRCLSVEQSRQFGLDDTPPRWCITGPGRERETDPSRWQAKWPYQDQRWKDWLVGSDRAHASGMPTPPAPGDPLGRASISR